MGTCRFFNKSSQTKHGSSHTYWLIQYYLCKVYSLGLIETSRGWITCFSFTSITTGPRGTGLRGGHNHRGLISWLVRGLIPRIHRHLRCQMKNDFPRVPQMKTNKLLLKFILNNIFLSLKNLWTFYLEHK